MPDPNFHELTIREIREETNDARTLVFEDHPDFSYEAGQYLTLKFIINGKEERRAYSMCSAPFQDELAVTVKQVSGGVVSNHIARNLSAGDRVEVMQPQGRFLLKTDPSARRDVYLFGAGSGITPLMSILRSVLEREPKSTVHLLYGNRNEDTIIFEQSLRELNEKYAGQLNLVHILSRPHKHKAGGLRGVFGGRKIHWNGEVGRIDVRAVHGFLDRFPGGSGEKLYFLCGPGQMIDTVEAALLGLGVDEKTIHLERFATPTQVTHNGTAAGAGAKVKAKISGKEIALTLKAGQSVLDGLLEAGATPPYSCLAGACSTCMAKVVSGGVKMEVCYALDDDEVAEGYVLACQSHPTTAELEVDFDV